MKFLTFDQIKAQLRLDNQQATDEHDLLELYGEAAEEIVLNTLNRTMEDIVEQYGDVPKALVQAGLMLVAQSYQHREPASPQNIYTVLDSFDMIIKPYMKLTSSSYESGYATRKTCNL